MDCQSNLDVKSVTGILLLIFGLLLTGSLIVVLLRASRLSVANLLVLHLTLADFLTFITLGPFFLTSVFMSSQVHEYPILCQVTGFLGRLTNTLSMYMITFTCLARCHSILWPLWHRSNIYKSKINRMATGVWCFAITISIAPFLGLGEYELIDGQCWCQMNSNKYPFNWFAYLTLVFLLPLVVNAICCVLALRKIFKSRSRCRMLSGRCGPSSFEMKIISNVTTPGKTMKGISSQNENSKKQISLDNSSDESICQKAPSISNVDKSNKSHNVGLKPEVDINVKVSTNEVTEDTNINITDLTLEKNAISSTQIENTIKVSTSTVLHVNEVSRMEDDTPTLKAKGKENTRQNVSQNCLSENSSSTNYGNSISTTQEIEPEAVDVNAQAGQTKIEQSNGSCGEKGIENTGLSGAKSMFDKISERESKLQKKKQYKPKQQSKNRTTSRVTLIISLTFIVYVIFSGQFFLIWSWYAIQPDSVPRLVFLMFRYGIALNPLLNSILYAFVSVEIRNNVLSMWKVIFKRCVCQN